MPRLSEAKAAFLACAVLLALPALPHLGAWFRLTHLFMTRTGGSPGPRRGSAGRLPLIAWPGGPAGIHRRLKGPWPGWQFVLAAAAFALVPPFGSHDAVYYFRLAERWAGGVNPYAVPFSVFNPFLGGGMAAVGNFLPYPPLWVLACGGLYYLAGGHLLAFFGLLKLLLGACHIGNFLLLRRCWPGAPAGEAAAWAYLAHSALPLEGLSMMHFDLLWLLACLAAAWQLRRGRWWPAVLAWSAAFWLKYSAAFALPLFLPALWEPGQTAARRIGLLAGGAAVVLAMGAATGWPFATGRADPRRARRLPGQNSPRPPSAAGRCGFDHLRKPVRGSRPCAAAGRPSEPDRTCGAAAWTVLILLPIAGGQPRVLALARAWLQVCPTDGHALEHLGCHVFGASFLYYPLLFVVGHLQASHDTVFQAWYAVLSHGPALVLLAAGLRERTHRHAAA
jgi:hypothetical protein